MQYRSPLAAGVAGGAMLAAAFFSAAAAAADTGDGGAAAGFTADGYTFTPVDEIADIDLGPLYSSGSATDADFDVADDGHDLGTVTGDADFTTIFGITNTDFTVDGVDPATGAADLPAAGTEYDVTSLPFGFEYVHVDEAGGGSTDTVVTPFGTIDLDGLFDGSDGSGGGGDTGGVHADASDILNVLNDDAVRFGEGDGLGPLKEGFTGGDLDDAVQALADDDDTAVLGDHVVAGDVDEALDNADMSVAPGADFGPGDISSALDDADESNAGPAFGDVDAGRLGTALDGVVVHDDGTVPEGDLSEALGDLNYDGVDFDKDDLVAAIEDHNWTDATDDVVTGNTFDGSGITEALLGDTDVTGSGSDFASDVDAGDIVDALTGS